MMQDKAREVELPDLHDLHENLSSSGHLFLPQAPKYIQNTRDKKFHK